MAAIDTGQAILKLIRKGEKEMDEWEDIDEYDNEGEELEEEIMEYCSECGNPIYDGDEYHEMSDGRILCESCFISLYGERF